MLDLRRIREEPDLIREAVRAKHVDVSVERILALDQEVRKAAFEIDQLRAEKNKLSGMLAKSRGQAADAPQMRERVRGINAAIKQIEDELKPPKEELHDLLLWLPNVPHVSVPVGGGPGENVVDRTWGEKPEFSFDPAPHWDLGSALSLLDQERAAKLAGSNFSLYSGHGALLVRGLINFMLDLHTREHGYTEYWPPFLATRQAMVGTGQLPKLEDDMYVCVSPELFLIPTGEVPLTNIFRGEILRSDQLPLRLVAFTSCFRREAGAYGKDTRGLNRVHQFGKVELVRIAEPERSYDELESLLADAEEVLQLLELPYRVLSLCTGDLSFAAAKCYDLEVWAAGQERWLEVSSCSNFEDFQARRTGIRYRPSSGVKPCFLHTINGSGLALPRVIAALLENNQTAEGTVAIPEALRPYLGGRAFLTGTT